MYFSNLSNENSDSAIIAAKNTNSEILSQLDIGKDPVLFPKGTDFTDLASKESKLFLLTSGQIELTVTNKSVLVYEEGDIVGIESELPVKCSAQSKDFAVYAIPLSVIEIEEKLGSKALVKLLASFSSLFFQAYASVLPGDVNVEPEVRSYNEGEIIVEQGLAGEDIYTLIEGSAEVFVDNQKVGKIQRDEVFGALAAITDSKRTATIKSSGNSLVLVIKKDQLIELIKMRPGTIEKLIGDLGRVIQDLNRQLADAIGKS